MESQKRFQKLHLHPLFSVVLFTIVLFGLMMILSASSVKSLAESNNIYSYFQNQVFYHIIGIIGAVFIAKYPYTKWSKILLPVNIVVVVCLLLTGFTPLGVEVNGAKRWLNLYVIQFQPSEISKMVIIVTTAYLLAKARAEKNLNTPKTLMAIGGYIISMSLLIGVPQNHASVVMILGLVTGTMLLIAGLNRFLFFAAAGGAVGVGTFIIMTSEFRRKRFLTFLDPLKDKMGDGFQITQNWYALGSGELFGLGLGMSRQRFSWLPEPHTDFILGIIGEELGYMGVLFVIALFVALLFFGVSIALSSENELGKLLVMGVMFLVTYQVVINLAVISGLFPVTGIPVPFISYGGTSGAILWCMMGIVYNVHSHNINNTVNKIE